MSGVSRRTVLIATAIIAINLLYAVLALTSIVPYLWSWNAHAGTVTVMGFYWNGQNEISGHPRTGATLLAECAIWSVVVVATLATGFLTARRIKRATAAKK
jgi:hypothetical protein